VDLTTFSNLFHRQNLNYTAPLGKTIKKFHWGFIQASPNREKLNALRHWVLSQGTRIGYGLKAQVQLSCLRTKSCLTESCGAPKSSPDLTRAKSRIEGNGNIQSPLSHELRRLNKFWAQIRVQRVKLRKNHYSIFNLSKKNFFRPLLIVKWPPLRGTILNFLLTIMFGKQRRFSHRSPSLRIFGFRAWWPVLCYEVGPDFRRFCTFSPTNC